MSFGRIAALATGATAALCVPYWLRGARRNTCLYRSVAECLVLRHYGIACRLRIGVQNSQPPGGAIAAHAWVVRGDREAAPASLTTLVHCRDPGS